MIWSFNRQLSVNDFAASHLLALTLVSVSIFNIISGAFLCVMFYTLECPVCPCLSPVRECEVVRRWSSGPAGPDEAEGQPDGSRRQQAEGRSGGHPGCCRGPYSLLYYTHTTFALPNHKMCCIMRTVISLKGAFLIFNLDFCALND